MATTWSVRPAALAQSLPAYGVGCFEDGPGDPVGLEIHHSAIALTNFGNHAQDLFLFIANDFLK